MVEGFACPTEVKNDSVDGDTQSNSSYNNVVLIFYSTL